MLLRAQPDTLPTILSRENPISLKMVKVPEDVETGVQGWVLY